MNIGDRGTFMASCGQLVTGEIVVVTEEGYLVRSDDGPSNQHADGLYRFTRA